MRIIKESTLKAMAALFPQAATWLMNFRVIARRAEWHNLSEIRADFPHADPVIVGTKRTVYVLNVCGNKYRLVIAIHFNRQFVFLLRLMTHAEYSKNEWKSEL